MPTEERVSAKFNDPNAEIRFVSSDLVVFHIYKDHLKSTSEILQVPDYTTVDPESTRVPLTERSEVLELLFQFVHPPSDDQQGRQPDLGTITDTKLFFDLAEAGEKYGVYALKTACIARMEVKLANEENSIEILNHCLLHDYYDRLVDQAGPQTLSESLEEVAMGLSRLEDLQHWLCYYKLYVDFRKFVTDQLYDVICRFPECHDLKALYTAYNERTQLLVNGIPTNVTNIRELRLFFPGATEPVYQNKKINVAVAIQFSSGVRMHGHNAEQTLFHDYLLSA